MDRIETVLAKVAQPLNTVGVVWGVGASVLLSRYGLITDPTDIDILVVEQDIQKVDTILSSLGKKQSATADCPVYITDFFSEYVIDGVNLDVIAGFKIKLKNSIFRYVFDQVSVAEHFPIKGISVPFSTLEDWYVLYQLMPHKENKVKLVEDYFHSNGIKHPFIFEQMKMNPNLPENVKFNIEKLL